jgi:outer membrane immunogenic protein
MKKLLLAIVGVAGVTGSALAADIAARPVYKAPPPAPAYSWSGCYIGAGGGGGMWTSEETPYTAGVVAGPDVSNGGRGWFGTVQAGCDYQFSPTWVIGAFGDYDFGSLKGDSNATFGTFGYTGEEKQRWSWAAGARLGWLPFDQLLTYVSAGYTQAHYRRTDYSLFGAATPTFFTDAHTYDGWFVGTGYEYRLGWLPGLTWKTEYRFADYGSDNLTAFSYVSGLPTTSSIDKEKFVHTVRSELVWRFNPFR